MLDLSVEALKILMYLQKSSLVLLFNKVAGLEFVPAILFEKDSTIKVFEILKKLLQYICARDFLTNYNR